MWTYINVFAITCGGCGAYIIASAIDAKFKPLIKENNNNYYKYIDSDDYQKQKNKN